MTSSTLIRVKNNRMFLVNLSDLQKYYDILSWPASWSTDVSLFYCSDINLLLNDYSWRELYNIWSLLFENNSRSVTLQKYHWKNNIVAVITRDNVIDDNLKRQIKNRTFFTHWLFVLTWVFNILAIGQNYFRF